MGYNVADIIEKAINIGTRKRIIYEKIGHDKRDILSINIISKVLLKEADKTIEYYKELLDEIKDMEFEEIDFSIYDKMSSLVSDFNHRMVIADVKNVREFLNYSLDMEKAVYSLLMDIQGRLVKNTDDIHTFTYRILGKIISNKAMQIVILEQTIEKIE